MLNVTTAWAPPVMAAASTCLSSGSGRSSPAATGSQPVTAANLNVLYLKFTLILTHAYEKRRAQNPGLEGHLILRVQVSAEGKAEAVEVTRNELPDARLVSLMQATLAEAVYPHEQKKLSFRFDLKPPRAPGAAAGASAAGAKEKR